VTRRLGAARGTWTLHISTKKHAPIQRRRSREENWEKKLSLLRARQKSQRPPPKGEDGTSTKTKQPRSFQKGVYRKLLALPARSNAAGCGAGTSLGKGGGWCLSLWFKLRYVLPTGYEIGDLQLVESGNKSGRTVARRLV